jgi:hypothetical protein
MTANQLIELMNRVPFEPFEFHLNDGSRIRVDHPYLVATSPHSASCTVYAENGPIARYVALRNVSQIVSPAT